MSDGDKPDVRGEPSLGVRSLTLIDLCSLSRTVLNLELFAKGEELALSLDPGSICVSTTLCSPYHGVLGLERDRKRTFSRI